jgi:predicted alpha-1,2-mannosidase
MEGAVLQRSSSSTARNRNKARSAALAFALLAGAFPGGAYAQSAPAANPVALVDPFVGTAGTSGVGLIDDFPGASAPFGMIQWSPDTPSQPPSGGYFYRDKAITGFSLTHLSGAGCQIYGDFAVLPVLGDVTDPQHAQQPFTHESETAQPGYYAVRLGNGVQVQLAAAPRAGIASFTFPASQKADLIVNTASDQAGVTQSQFQVVGPDEIAGSATSGGFCGMPNVYTVYFDMKFDRPFTAHGTWTGKGNVSGGWLSFDTTQNRTVQAKAAVSYVSIAGARANLENGIAGWNLDTVRSSTANAWQSLLGEVRISGGTPADRKMFYTSLYHSLLSPTLYSDADGTYLGFDGRVHRTRSGHDEYANFSGWDIYRTQVPLMALLAPHQSSDMMQTLVDNAQQGGWLPKWPAANGYTAVMGGDSADAIIAGAYAFGARDFDRAGALRAMLKNADDVSSSLGQGWYHPRPGSAEYLQHGYVVNAHTTNVSPVPNGASETLEYAIDDFSISQFAKALGKNGIYRQFAKRGQNWTNIFDTSTGLVSPRDADGAFMQTPLTSNGQSGFQEGNAEQYTWMVPQAMGSLVAALGGSQNAIARLDTFFSQLNAGSDKPYAWFGNEPTFAAPWTYLYAGAPYKAQAVNRNVMLSLYAPTPDGIPGNDDLGAMSSWWAWNAMGLYPINPAVPVLLLGTPIFTNVTIDSPSGRRIVVDAPAASDANAYIESLRIDGKSTDRAWVNVPQSGTVHLDYVVGPTPNTQFGANPQDAPPNYMLGLAHFPPSTTAQFAMPPVTIDIAAGGTAALHFQLTNAAQNAQDVRWTAAAPPGFSVTPSNGSASAAQNAPAALDASVTASGSVQPGLYNVAIEGRSRNGAPLAHVDAVLRVDRQGDALPLIYVANFSDDTVLPTDPRTGAHGNAIPVGSRPGGLAVSADGTRLYTANQSSNDVSVVDTKAGKTIATIKMGHVPAGIDLSPDGKTLWVSNFGDDTLQPVDIATLKAGAPIKIDHQPEEVAVSPDGSKVYVVAQGSNAIDVVDAATRSLQTKIPTGDHPLGAVLSRDGSRIYVSNMVSNDVTVIDALRGTVVKHIPVGKTPQAMAISPDGSLLYVADSAASQVTPIDLQTGTARAPITVGNGPFAVEFSADGSKAVVADSGDNDCAVVDVARGVVADHIAAGSFPIALARARQ